MITNMSGGGEGGGGKPIPSDQPAILPKLSFRKAQKLLTNNRVHA